MTPGLVGTARARVLTIDDEAQFRAVARELVEATVGFTPVGEASTGLQGIDLARELQPDVVLLDINLPDLHGLDVCAQLRDMRPKPIVVLVSADDDAHFDEEARRCGAVAFVPKNQLTPSLLQRLWSAGDDDVRKE